MFDTHCHLSYAPLYDQIDAVLQRAADAGVTRMLTVGTRLTEAKTSLELARRYPHIHCAVGVHPHYAAEATADELAEVCGMFADPLVLAVGEMGLDFHYEFSPRDAQQRVFESQLEAAARVGKPLVLHCREAIDPSLAILRNIPTLPGVFHCFTGTMDEAKRVLDAGYYIGITGVVTFKNADVLRDIARMIPADRLLLETDAPYLAPEPVRRQKNNEPALIAHVFRCVALLRGVSVDQLAAETTANAHKLFAIPLPM